MKKFLTFAALATVACAVILSSCKKDDPVPVPVVTITTQPTAPAALTEGSVAGSLTVAATATEGATLSYQWYSNTSASNTGGTAVSGATSANFTLPATLATGTYYYFCEVSAEGAKSVRTNAVTVTVGAAPVAYPITGKAGTLDWSLDEDGTLTVSGTGTMPDYALPTTTRADGDAAPWSAYADEIKVVVIVEGVTNVGAGAFAGLTVLVEVSLPDSVESIGDGAFAGCTVLVEINIPADVEIGEGAFEGCDELPEVTIPVTGVSVEPATLTLTEGDTETLTATVAPANATDKTVAWSSSDPAITTVDAATGVVTAVAPGTATITATAGDKTATCAVTVEAEVIPVTGVSVEPATLTLTVGDTETLAATVAPANATDKTVAWSSSDPVIATVDAATGVVTAVAPGTATITATAGGKTATCTVTVEAEAASLQDLINECKELYADMMYAYVSIDKSYSTLSARQSLTPATAALSDFWQTAYGVITRSDDIIGLIDNDGLMSEVDKNEYKGHAALCSGTAYMYLATLFGDVPVAGVMPWMSLPESSANDVLDYALGNFDMAAGMLSGIESVQARFGKMLVAAGRKDYQTVAMLFAELMDSGTIALNDANRDGVFNAADNFSSANMLAVQARLLGVEANLAIGNTMNAVHYLAGLAEVSPGATAEEIRTAVNGLWPSWNDGMKFMNEARWGNTASWGKHELMPIPSEAIRMNGRLTQNPGW